MNRFALLAILAALAAGKVAGQNGAVRVDAGVPLAHFKVDGQEYAGSAMFVWPKGSKHLLEVAATQSATGTQYTCGPWSDSNGLISPGSNTVTVTADPTITTYSAGCALSGYRVTLLLTPGSPLDATSAACSAPGDPSPVTFRPGVVFVSGTCYWSTTVIYASGVINLNAFPYPGFVFIGWSVNTGPPNASLRSYEVNGDVVIAARFEPAKRVKFMTDPAGLQVLVDRTPTPTPENDPCPGSLTLPPLAPMGIAPLCIGEFDFAEGSKHVIGAPTPQSDKTGRPWVFDSYTNGMGQNDVYTALTANVPDRLTAKFVPGARVSFVTDPPNLKLKVDGRENWPAYNFVWAVGTKHQVSAPAEQFDARGRKFVFKAWSNGSTAAQDITVPLDGDSTGLRLIAYYDTQNRVVIQTTPPGITVQVDGDTCTTPCNVDRNSGAQVRIVAPATAPVSDVSRLEFASWSDGGDPDRTVTVTDDYQVLSAAYRTTHLFRWSAEPTGGASVRVDPTSADGYYPAGSQLVLSAGAKPGFRFRRWDGDVSSSSPTVVATLNRPMAVRAMLDRVPYIAPAGVRNAAAETPEAAVAPGSVISIVGASLAAEYQAGPASPLAQTLGNVTVRVNDRLLPLLFVSPEQINAQLPSDLGEGQYWLAVRWEPNADVTSPFQVVRNAPGLFIRPGEDRPFAVAAHEDGSPVTLDSPARRGETVSLFGTGFGPYDRPAPDGFGVPDSPAYKLADPVSIVIGDLRVDPVWCGAAPGFVGTVVTRLKISDDLPAATTVELRVQVNGKDSNTVLLPLE